MSVVRKSFLSSLAEAHLSLLIQLASMVVLARILTPGEIGIYSVAAAVVLLTAMIRDFGVAEYLIQEQDLSRDTMRAALAAQILVSWMLAVLLFLSSGALAAFYNEPGV